MIIVANVKNYDPDDVANGMPVYIGRAMRGLKGSPLRNPFKLAKGESRESCLARYTDWFRSLPVECEERRELVRLVEIARNWNLVLLCWCAPEKCHGDVIKEMIEAELMRLQWTRPQTAEITATDGPMTSITIPATDGPVMLSSAWESEAKALDLMTTDRNFWRSAFEDCAADGFSAAEQAIAQRIAAISEECDALRAKAAAFDVLAAKLLSGAWEVLLGTDGRIVVALVPHRSSVAAPTLAEAVKAAMEAEGR